MGIFRQFPYSNFHEMNMDEIIKIVKTMHEEWLATKSEWATYKDFIDNYFDTLDLSEETYNALVRMIENGILNYVTPEMFGAKGDGITDDTQAVQDAFNTGNTVVFNNKTYLINCGETWVDGGVIPSSNQLIILNSATLKATTNISGSYSVLNIKNKENVMIMGGKIIGDADTHADENAHLGYGLTICQSKNITVCGTEISKCQGDSVMINTITETTGICDQITITNCVFHDNKRQGVSIVVGTNITIENCEIYNIGPYSPRAGIDIESELTEGSPNISNVHINNCYIHDTQGASINISWKREENIYINNCKLAHLTVGGGENCNITNCVMDRINTFSPHDLYVNNCVITGILNYAIQHSGTQAVYENCKLILKTDCPAFIKTNSESGVNLEKLIFRNCIFKADDRSSAEIGYLLSYTGSRLSYVEFDGCTIELGTKMRLHESAPKLGYIFNNCDISFTYNTANPWLIIPSNLTEFNITIKNSKVDAPNFAQLIYSEMPANSTLNLVILNSEINSPRTFLAPNEAYPNGYALISNNIVDDLSDGSMELMTKAISNNIII